MLTIDRAWKNRHVLGSTKTNKARVIPLAPSVLEHLPPRGDGLIFCYASGKRLQETWWRKNWYKIEIGKDKHGKPVLMGEREVKVTPPWAAPCTKQLPAACWHITVLYPGLPGLESDNHHQGASRVYPHFGR